MLWLISKLVQDGTSVAQVCTLAAYHGRGRLDMASSANPKVTGHATRHIAKFVQWWLQRHRVQPRFSPSFILWEGKSIISSGVRKHWTRRDWRELRFEFDMKSVYLYCSIRSITSDYDDIEGNECNQSIWNSNPTDLAYPVYPHGDDVVADESFMEEQDILRAIRCWVYLAEAAQYRQHVQYVWMRRAAVANKYNATLERLASSRDHNCIQLPNRRSRHAKFCQFKVDATIGGTWIDSPTLQLKHQTLSAPITTQKQHLKQWWVRQVSCYNQGHRKCIGSENPL